MQKKFLAFFWAIEKTTMPNAGCERECKTKCKALIDAELEVNPHVRCIPLHAEKGRFEIDLFLNSKPHCRIVESRKHESKGCTTGCNFVVEFEWPCDATLRTSKCQKPRAQFLLEVASEYKIDCELVKSECGKKEESSSEEPKEEKKCKKFRKH